MSLAVSFYDLKKVHTNKDCDHGHCVGMTINHGGKDHIVWLYVEDKAAADKLADHLKEVVKEVQLIDYV